VIGDAGPTVRCSVSSWYTDPAFRSYGAMLAAHARRHRQATYVNITPEPSTWPMLDALGYRRYCNGRFIAIPAISRTDAACTVTLVDEVCSALPQWEAALLLEHARYGCISLLCTSADGCFPFVFLPAQMFGRLPYAQLAYCRQVQDFTRFAGILGRFLARRGLFLVEIDADGPLLNLPGRYFDNAPKFFCGSERPRLGDLAYSERVMFGF
jgi:hypothetical protein